MSANTCVNSHLPSSFMPRSHTGGCHSRSPVTLMVTAGSPCGGAAVVAVAVVLSSPVAVLSDVPASPTPKPVVYATTAVMAPPNSAPTRKVRRSAARAEPRRPAAGDLVARRESSPDVPPARWREEPMVWPVWGKAPGLFGGHAALG